MLIYLETTNDKDKLLKPMVPEGDTHGASRNVNYCKANYNSLPWRLAAMKINELMGVKLFQSRRTLRQHKTFLQCRISTENSAHKWRILFCRTWHRAVGISVNIYLLY